jgi:hypothetical protein
MTTYSAALPKHRGRKTFRNARVYIGAGPVENRGWAKVTESEYNALTEYLPDLLYIVVSDVDNSYLSAYIDGEPVGIFVDFPDVPDVDGIQFLLDTPYPTDQPGALSWDTEEETLSLGLHNGVVLQFGQEVHYHVKNKTGQDIPDGTLVMFAGTDGQSGKLLIAPAIANGTVPVRYIMGITTQAIPNDDTGYVTHFGKVRGLDTTIYQDPANPTTPQLLWADPLVPGGLTRVMPAAPYPKVLVAATVSFHSQVGTIIVRVTHGEYVSELHDVDAASLDTGDCLVRGSDGIWRGQPYKNWVSLTETEYAALVSPSANTLYLVKDDVSGLLSAIYVGSVLLFTAP